MAQELVHSIYCTDETKVEFMVELDGVNGMDGPHPLMTERHAAGVYPGVRFAMEELCDIVAPSMIDV